MKDILKSEKIDKRQEIDYLFIFKINFHLMSNNMEMYMVFKKILNILIYIVISLFFVSKVESQQFKPFPEDRSNRIKISDNDKLEWQDYPMAVVYPTMKVLIVRIPKDANMIFDKNKWTNTNMTTNIDELPNWSEHGNQLDFKMKSLNKESVNIRFNVKQNAIMQLKDTIIESIGGFAATQFQSTWHGTGVYPVAKVIPIDDASFIANTGEHAPYHGILYAIHNLRIGCYYGNNIIKLEEIIELAKEPLKLFSKSNKTFLYEELKDIRLSVPLRMYDTAVVNWSVDKKYDDYYWVRIDADAGDISILEKGKIIVSNIPKEGTRIHCYVISSDGTTFWCHNSIFISGEPGVPEICNEKVLK